MAPRTIVVCLCCLTACAPKVAPHGAQKPTTAAAALRASAASADAGGALAPLTVSLVIDQFAAWVARDRLGLLPKDGGFARLRNEGTWYQDMRFAHAVTDTAPGHASLYSGKVPREHGIVANDVWRAGKVSAILVDEATRAVTAEGERPEYASSAQAVTTELVADRFKAQVPNAKVYSLSLKDRGAIFGGGHHPDLSLWYDPKLERFLSSTAFVQRLPDWVVPALGHEALKQRLDKIWMPLRDIGNEMRPCTYDDEPGESDFAFYGAKFPHQPSHSTQPFAAFRANPESDRMLLELALLAVDNSPRDCPTLLAISLSANDYIGHLFGPDSWEAKDELLRLDAALGWFFTELDRRRGSAHWNAVLAADHGVVPLPELSQIEAKRFHEGGTMGSRPQELTHRVLPTDLKHAAELMSVKAVGKGQWVAALSDPYVYLSDEARHLGADKLARLRAALIEGLAKLPEVARVFDVASLASGCPSLEDESLNALVCRSVQPGRGGDYYVALKPGYFFDAEYVTGSGTSHGNAELADRSVPLLVRAPGAAEAGKVVTNPQWFTMFARQLEPLLGLQ
jgi:hypothetical protein